MKTVSKTCEGVGWHLPGVFHDLGEEMPDPGGWGGGGV